MGPSGLRDKLQTILTLSFHAYDLPMDQAAEERTDAIIAATPAMLRLLADGLMTAFGAPAAMLKKRPFGKIRERMSRWLHDMEYVARRLLLLRATRFAPRPFDPISALPAQPAAKIAPVASNAREVADVVRAYIGEPATWRVQSNIQAPRDPVWEYENPIHRRARQAHRAKLAPIYKLPAPSGAALRSDPTRAGRS